MSSRRLRNMLVVALVAFAALAAAGAGALLTSTPGGSDGPDPFTLIAGGVLAVCAVAATIMVALLLAAIRRSRRR